MRKHKDYQRLVHVVKYCEKLMAVSSSMKNDYSVFASKKNYEKVDVSAFYIGQIGELVHGLTDDFKNAYTDIPWKQIIDMRNTLIHKYGTRDIKIIWDVITEDIPALNVKCRKILIRHNSSAEYEINKELAEETNILL